MIVDPIENIEKELGFRMWPTQKMMFMQMWDGIRTNIKVYDRVCGKTTVIHAYATAKALERENRKIFIGAPVFRIAKMGFKDGRTAFKKDKAVSISTASEAKISFDNGSIIYTLPIGHDGRNLICHRANIIILDEAQFMDPELENKFVKPMLNISLPECPNEYHRIVSHDRNLLEEGIWTYKFKRILPGALD